MQFTFDPDYYYRAHIDLSDRQQTLSRMLLAYKEHSETLASQWKDEACRGVMQRNVEPAQQAFDEFNRQVELYLEHSDVRSQEFNQMRDLIDEQSQSLQRVESASHMGEELSEAYQKSLRLCQNEQNHSETQLEQATHKLTQAGQHVSKLNY
ncbi:hypothetical protein [Vibrio sp. WXL210]|uniref:hypothetical protein n=1 Tax=Vibrio sp. WXL210 TaxID=3450709 RepID=UPI003EC548F0